MNTPEFKEWKRKKEDAARWRLFEWAKRAIGALFLVALGIYAACLNGWITLPSAGKFQF